MKNETLYVQEESKVIRDLAITKMEKLFAKEIGKEMKEGATSTEVKIDLPRQVRPQFTVCLV